ncbi:hypothetical protein [Vitreimonas flagellata]|uniref:hypothetical protein n=1 Tax=Vitreimonas flagellata TaxID=2560861 RepID=UPI00107520E7|nr:hypothetical protein [Vitreimonas flagellata]
MKQIGVSVLVFAIACCGAGEALAQLPGRPALDFSQRGSASGNGEDSAFARSVTARYASGVTRAQLLADLRAQGFSCEASGASCTHVAMQEACADVRAVDIAQDGTISASHVLRCMGALADDE